jgi:hypothetical protein
VHNPFATSRLTPGIFLIEGIRAAFTRQFRLNLAQPTSLPLPACQSTVTVRGSLSSSIFGGYFQEVERMRTIIGVTIALCTAALFGVFSPNAQADEWNRKTVVSFDAPVEIPGQVLPAGTYVFSLVNSMADRHIVQIWTGDGMHLIGTVMAVPATRMRPPNDSVFTFEERAADSPLALKTWFCTGDTIGQEFLYPNNYPNSSDYTPSPEN